jgi:hypothetical protein
MAMGLGAWPPAIASGTSAHSRPAKMIQIGFPSAPQARFKRTKAARNRAVAVAPAAAY